MTLAPYSVADEEGRSGDVARHWPVLAMGYSTARVQARADGDLGGLTNSLIGTLGLAVGVIALV